MWNDCRLQSPLPVEYVLYVFGERPLITQRAYLLGTESLENDFRLIHI